jgi:hypothetical protein
MEFEMEKSGRRVHPPPTQLNAPQRTQRVGLFSGLTAMAVGMLTAILRDGGFMINLCILFPLNGWLRLSRPGELHHRRLRCAKAPRLPPVGHRAGARTQAGSIPSTASYPAASQVDMASYRKNALFLGWLTASISAHNIKNILFYISLLSR